MSLSTPVRHRLEAQGFTCDVAGFEQVEPWLRFTPALCTILLGIATALALPSLLWASAGLAALGAVFPVHPFDLLYTASVRSLARTPALPRNGPPRRFACGVASVWLAGEALAFQTGSVGLGYAAGALVVAIGLVVTTTHFCVPSTLYQAIFALLIRGRQRMQAVTGQRGSAAAESPRLRGGRHGG